METVRTGLIGLGARGGFHLRQLLLLDGVEVKALCDIHEPTMREHMDYREVQGAPRPDGYARGEYDYRRMLEREDLDIVVIATPWRWHTPMAVDAMQAGKHAFIEVPAAITVEVGSSWKRRSARDATA